MRKETQEIGSARYSLPCVRPSGVLNEPTFTGQMLDVLRALLAASFLTIDPGYAQSPEPAHRAGLVSNCPKLKASAAPVIESRYASGSLFVQRDGKVGRLWQQQDGRLFADSTADGHVWQTTEWEAPVGFRYSITPVVQLSNGTVLVFSMRRRCVDACRIRAREWFIDIWVTRFTAEGRLMGSPERLWDGYVGDLRRALVTATGLIIMPFAAWNPDLKMGPPTGPHQIKLLVSRDDGRTFQLLEPNLVAPVPELRSRGAGYGGVEPAIGRRPDGRLVMLIRTQTDVLWQAESNDGMSWTPAAPTALAASSSPPILTETADGSLVAIWNNTYQPSLHDNHRVYGGRDALHAAIMRPGRSTWEGLREIYIDDALLQSEAGDRGTAYPVAAQLPNGDILAASGQGKGRRKLIRFSLEWLTEQFRVDRLPAGQRTWIGFQEFGEPIELKRPRREVALVPPTADAGVQLKTWDAEGAAALWNFPAAQQGEISLSLHLRRRAKVELALLDRFFNPYDPALSRHARARVVSGVLGTGVVRVTVEWDAGGMLRATFPGNALAPVAAAPAETGYNYLWIKVVPESTDGEGVVATIHETCKLPPRR